MPTIAEKTAALDKLYLAHGASADTPIDEIIDDICRFKAAADCLYKVKHKIRTKVPFMLMHLKDTFSNDDLLSVLDNIFNLVHNPKFNPFNPSENSNVRFNPLDPSHPGYARFDIGIPPQFGHVAFAGARPEAQHFVDALQSNMLLLKSALGCKPQDTLETMLSRVIELRVAEKLTRPQKDRE